MTNNTLCPGCFSDKGHVNPCPHCGYDESVGRSPLALPHRPLLQDQFLIGRILGKPGGFGVTYLARDCKLETILAIKEYLPRDLAGRETGRTTVVPHSREDGKLFDYGLDQFLVEARTLVQLDHPNIVRVRHLFEANATAYLVMDYYRGQSLGELLDRQGKLPEQDAVRLLMPVLDGLRAVHAKGFLHRDIKPDNIYLATIDGGGIRPILLDFGAARQAVGERSRSLSVIFTPGYAPFEQYHRKGKQGPWTDIYSAAAVLYRMVTGETPPEANERVAEDDLQPAAAFGVSRRLSDALGRALAIQPPQRPQSVQGFQTAIACPPERSPSPPPEPPSSPPTPPGPVPQPSRRNWLPWAVVGLLGVALVLALLRPFGDWFPAGDDGEQQEANRQTELERQRQLEKQRQREETERKAQRDLAAWRSTEQRNDSAGYQSYLNDCTANGCGYRSQAEAELAKLAAQDKTRDPVTGMEFVQVPGGCYQMGSDDGRSNEKPVHEVCVDDFWLGKHEVTQGQWTRIMGDNPSTYKSGEDYPVESVSWDDVQAFIGKLNAKGSAQYRLPTEAEWEYACRSGGKDETWAGTSTKSRLDDYANICDEGSNCQYDWKESGLDDGYPQTAPVGHFTANDLGLYDMSGNVWEWVQDIYTSDAYSNHSRNNPVNTGGGSRRVYRGGGWDGFAASARCASRDSSAPGSRSRSLGVRLLRN